MGQSLFGEFDGTCCAEWFGLLRVNQLDVVFVLQLLQVMLNYFAQVVDRQYDLLHSDLRESLFINHD